MVLSPVKATWRSLHSVSFVPLLIAGATCPFSKACVWQRERGLPGCPLSAPLQAGTVCFLPTKRVLHRRSFFLSLFVLPPPDPRKTLITSRSSQSTTNSGDTLPFKTRGKEQFTVQWMVMISVARFPNCTSTSYFVLRINSEDELHSAC